MTTHPATGAVSGTVSAAAADGGSVTRRVTPVLGRPLRLTRYGLLMQDPLIAEPFATLGLIEATGDLVSAHLPGCPVTAAASTSPASVTQLLTAAGLTEQPLGEALLGEAAAHGGSLARGASMLTSGPGYTLAGCPLCGAGTYLAHLASTLEAVWSEVAGFIDLYEKARLEGLDGDDSGAFSRVRLRRSSDPTWAPLNRPRDSVAGALVDTLDGAPWHASQDRLSWAGTVAVEQAALRMRLLSQQPQMQAPSGCGRRQLVAVSEMLMTSAQAGLWRYSARFVLEVPGAGQVGVFDLPSAVVAALDQQAARTTVYRGAWNPRAWVVPISASTEVALGEPSAWVSVLTLAVEARGDAVTHQEARRRMTGLLDGFAAAEVT